MDRSRLIDIIQKEFSSKRIMVIGDLMVDRYITGRVGRISPEAPVPVLDYSGYRMEAGGASNVARNIRAMGGAVTVSGLAADDEGGRWLRDHLNRDGIETDHIFSEEGRMTTVKTRYITSGHQLLRVDKESNSSAAEITKERILDSLEKEKDILDGIVLSDYRKGVLTDGHLIRRIVEKCNKSHIPITVDSKTRDISVFRNADIVKPNNLELEEAVGIRIVDEDSLNKAGEAYLKKSGARNLIVTRGAKGISLFRKDRERKDYPAPEVQVFDVTGAGDTVISTVVLSIACGITVEDAIPVANTAAGVVISKIGTTAVTADELVRKLK